MYGNRNLLQNIAGDTMKKIFNLFALVFTSFTILSLSQTAVAQYKYYYSSNIWVNSGMNLLFQKRWEIARIRAAGKNQLADAMEGRRSNNKQTTFAAPQNAQQAENILRRVPLSHTAFKRINVNTFRINVGIQLLDKNASEEEKQTLYDAMDELLKNYDQMLVEQKETRLKNNVAGAATFAILMCRSILTGNELSEKQAEGLLQDINSLLASSDKFKEQDDIKKQQMYEAFVITSGLATMLYQQGKDENIAEKMAQGKDLAKTVLSQFFDRPLDEIEFTNDGVQFQ